jgi:hypothetical protein
VEGCSFCGVSSREYPLAGRSTLWVCEPCVLVLEDVLHDADFEASDRLCSFCFGNRATVEGPSIYICESCVHEATRELSVAAAYRLLVSPSRSPTPRPA